MLIHRDILSLSLSLSLSHIRKIFETTKLTVLSYTYDSSSLGEGFAKLFHT